MAQPTRAVRARRARTRRSSASGRNPDQLPARHVFTQTERVWNTWIVACVSALWRRTHTVSQAVRSARAALHGIDNIAAPHSRISWQSNWRFLLRRSGIPLRLAAHLVTLSIVFLVIISSVFGSFSSDTAGAASPVPAITSPATVADVQIQRSIGSMQSGMSESEALPQIRTPDLVLAPAFVETHVVAEGETLGQIAAQYHTSVAALFWSNDIASESVFAAGQELRIPRLAGVPHVIAEGETLDSIAAQFGVRPQAITLFKSNNLQSGEPLPVGGEIFIPNGSAPYPADILTRLGGEAGIASLRAVAAGTVQEAETNLRVGPGRAYAKIGTLDAGKRLKLLARHEQWVKVEDGIGQTGWVRADLLGLSANAIAAVPETNDFPALPPVWVWPAHGSITSQFGWRSAPFRSFHDGLDIANAAWTKIYAARRGEVYESGWCSGFGYCVKIDHGDGITTIYGHMIKKPPVKVGTMVEAGDLIGYMGSTYDRSGGGYSTGVHLHFTVKINGKAVNPMKFLP